VGVNCFVDAQEQVPLPLLEIGMEVEEQQRARLVALRGRRDDAAVKLALDRLREIAAGTENTMPAFIEAVRAYATLGEIVGVMKEVFGIYEEPTWV